ncbi:alpha/beta hydrolase family protein [Arsukibacterium indicum]|uniref:Alpha/beta fold hydrolase n=1 Tax=Arsukibacterium indicum TaxID=2848612 RepID=A0ABS6MM16_9GAMM|nr:alpha/beta fold hydrolase [Arsukibacterium indicum]MBV2129864.1 alpha/beta fold hydrolase [Arsukibacterium indicum]
MNKIIIALLTGTTLLLHGCAQRQVVNEQETAVSTSVVNQHAINNVSYSSLAALPYNDTSIRLQYGPEPLQYGQLYLPPAATLNKRAPLLVFIHGGCWLNAYDISHSRAFSQAVANAGVAVWSVEYRRTGDEGGGWPGTYTDVLQALQYSQQALSAYAVDSSNIAIAGHSAGGQLALLAAGQAYQQLVSESLPSIKGVIGLAAITDMPAYASGTNSCQRAASQFLGGTASEQPQRYQEANPGQQVMHPATLLLHGSADTIVPLEQASNSNMSYQIIADAGHFDWIHPHTRAYKQFIAFLQELLQSDNPKPLSRKQSD